MISIVAHELRGALSTVSGYSRLMLRPDSKVDRRMALRAIATGSDHLDRLTQDLLDSADLQAGRLTLKRQSCDLSKIVLDNAAHYQELADHTIEVRVPGPIFGNWDELRLTQVVRNLLGNSLKYSPASQAVEVLVAGDREEAMVAVCNAASGLSPEDVSRLFQPYSRFDRHKRLPAPALACL